MKYILINGKEEKVYENRALALKKYDNLKSAGIACQLDVKFWQFEQCGENFITVEKRETFKKSI